MRTHRHLVVATSLLAAHAGTAQVNTVYDFENLVAGTSVTNQYRGVVFSRNFGANVTPLVIAAENNSSSPTRVLRTNFPSEEFSPQFLRMNFAQPQRFVQFAVGTTIFCNAPSNRMIVRWFNAAGTQLGTRTITFNVTGANTMVSLGSESGPFEIARVEVDGTVPGVCAEQGESIDDLRFLPDTTPPTLTITAPADDACVCGNTPVVVSGVACDADGIYAGDRLEFSTFPDGPWTLVSSASSSLCAGGTLYNWDTSALSGGHYYIRITATNADGWSTSEVRRIFLDKNGPSINLRSPASSPVGFFAGSICFDGSVGNEGCSSPFWRIQWRATGTTPWNDIDDGQTSSIVNDPLGSWNISERADGPYQVRITARDQCNFVTDLTPVNVVVDNTPPVAQITSPVNCDELDGLIIVRGTAFDANLSGWTLQVAGGPWNSWQTIATGTSNVTNGILGTFNTAGRPPCAYALRLIVSDRSVANCGPGTQSREFVTTFDLQQAGVCDDIDFNNDGLFPSDEDVIAFFRVLAGGPC